MLYMAKYTDQGGRRSNEDSYGIFAKGNELCAIVADGLGSYGGGEIASKMAVDMLRDYYMSAHQISQNGIENCFTQINQAIYGMQTEQCKMKTTVAVLFASGSQCVWAHVGDTRIYHFVDNRLKDMTLDHSLPQMAVFKGEITQSEIRHHKDRNKLLRAMGYRNPVQVDVSPVGDVSTGDHAFLLCTDGFWEYVEEKDMIETLERAQNPVQWVKDMTNILQSRVDGKNDNNTAVAVWVKNN